MNVTDLQEIWQVEAGGQIYEARFEELAQWIEEGSLLRQDKVRRGRLRWIEARKVPGLVEFFNEKDSINFVSSTTVAGQAAENIQSSAENYSETFSANSLPENASAAESFQNVSGFADSPEGFQNERNYDHSHSRTENSGGQNTSQKSEICCVHREAAADYFCDTCANAFCKSCPTSYGGSVKICPFCGAMCRLIKKYEEVQQKHFGYDAAINEGFGFTDFSRALAHPFKFKTSLFFGAILFAVFSFGQSAASIGGTFIMFSAFFCVMASNMLTFGILANTVENFSEGKLETNFMPDFDDFSMWDDVLHPFFLSIGAYISSFGPFILVLIIGIYLVFSSMTAQINTVQDEISKIPGTEFYDTRKTARQSDEVKQLTDNLRRQNEQRLNQQSEIATGNQPAAINEEEAEFERLNEMIRQSRKEQLESVAGKSPETRQKEYAQMFQGFLNLAPPLVVIGFLAFLWGLFYLPAACAVAGYTRSFTATINPLVGLDTIKRLGFDYVKILLMGFLIILMSAFVGMILSVIFSPFDMPVMGNLPAKVFGSIFTFYFSIVFSCILGYALFKNADKLKLYR
ncbi:MAG: hypothetical protein H0U50_10930 [Pyrinomonadaceae bacterium]|nr:hypothetical protein [Pyrinomonadaceae bacterium]